MTIHCEDARPLVPSYLDGELSEAQAAPLRKHLLDCQPCRATAQSDKVLRRWFVSETPVAIPPGFASRVARRAFAGDTGSGDAGSAGLEAQTAGAAGVAGEGGAVFRFVLRLTAVAAVLLVFLSIGLGSLTRPAATDLQADSTPTFEDALRRLERLNREESAPSSAAGREDENGEAGPSAAKDE